MMLNPSKTYQIVESVMLDATVYSDDRKTTLGRPTVVLMFDPLPGQIIRHIISYSMSTHDAVANALARWAPPNGPSLEELRIEIYPDVRPGLTVGELKKAMGDRIPPQTAGKVERVVHHMTRSVHNLGSSSRRITATEFKNIFSSLVKSQNLRKYGL